MTEWMSQAACKNEDPRWFFPEDIRANAWRRAQEQAAKAVCARCGVRDECLQYSLEAVPVIQDGIWGGMTARERGMARRKLPKLRTCLYCQRLFTATHTRQGFCGDECRRLRNNEQTKLWKQTSRERQEAAS